MKGQGVYAACCLAQPFKEKFRGDKADGIFMPFFIVPTDQVGQLGIRAVIVQKRRIGGSEVHKIIGPVTGFDPAHIFHDALMHFGCVIIGSKEKLREQGVMLA